MKHVLHVLPHPGGGGETYVDGLERMEGYSFERVFLARSPKPSPTVLREAAGVLLAARRYDLVHVHGEIAAGVCLPTVASRPSVVTFNGLHLLRRVNRAVRPAAIANLRLVVRAASRTICVAEAEREDVVGAVGPRTAAERVVVIYNGVDPAPPPSGGERAIARERLGLSPDVAVGIFVGSLDDRKDPLVAARAAGALVQEGLPFVLLFAGDGPLRAELEGLARTHHGAMRLLGFQADVPGLLAAADFFVLPSQREGFSFAVLEAMALGLPAIVSDAPGFTEQVGEAGIVVECGDVDGFTDAFRRLMNAEERASLGAAARERVRKRFTLGQMVQQTQRVYELALGSA